MYRHLLIRVTTYFWVIFSWWFLLVAAFSFQRRSFSVRLIHRPSILSFNRQSVFHLALESFESSSVDDEEEDEENPLAIGIDSVSWLPNVKEIEKQDHERNTDVEILPLLPLGVYTPQSNQVLNIFEPRYIQLYNDILMNGSKRFAVTLCHPLEPGKFAEIGVIFQLEDLKEVSEMTADKVKYVCDHRVSDRIQIHRILNPEAWGARETYLKVEAKILHENSNGHGGGKEEEEEEEEEIEERMLRESFASLVELQNKLKEDVRFTNSSVPGLKVQSGIGPNSLWETVRLWHSYTQICARARESELQREFRGKLISYLQNQKKLKEKDIAGATIDIKNLTPELQKDVKELQKRMAAELKPLALETTLTLQKILEANTHSQRLKMLRLFVEAESRRLKAKHILRGMFTGSKGGGKDDVVDKVSITSATQPVNGFILLDEPDAFQ